MQPFHLAIPVQNLEICRDFYGKILGCEEVRSSDKWVDFNFFGHQLVIHSNESFEKTLEFQIQLINTTFLYLILELF